MKRLSKEDIRENVREHYGQIARAGATSCRAPSRKHMTTGGSTCCGSFEQSSAREIGLRLGYSVDDLNRAPPDANLGLGCGNPHAIAALKEGETVLDLGSGAGFDCFLAAQQVGPQGQVIGVDMTPEMVHRARMNAQKSQFRNVEFRLGEIEHLPVSDNSMNVIISNCVINLSPEKPKVMREVFRVLKPGGRLAISDIVATAPLPREVQQDAQLISGCIGGASTTEELQRELTETGFREICIQPKEETKELIHTWAPEVKIEDLIVSATIEAVKPVGTKSHVRLIRLFD